MNRPLALLALPLLLIPDASAAGKAIDADWPVIAQIKQDECVLTVTGNGRFVRIEAEGLGAGSAGRYRLYNSWINPEGLSIQADGKGVFSNNPMTPIEWSIRADGEGHFARYYVPFRWGQRGGEIEVTVRAGDCDLTTTFRWRRYTGVTH